MTDSSGFSFEDAEGAQAPSDALTRLNTKIGEAIELKQVVDQLEEDLKAAKQQLQLINTSVLPDMMAEIGVEKIVQNGWEVKVSDFVSGSLPKDDVRKAAAIRWLEDHDAGELLKTSLSVDFSRSQHNEALNLAGSIEQQGFAPKVESTVHPQTLAAFARERIKSGEAIDTEVLGLYTGRVAQYKNVGG